MHATLVLAFLTLVSSIAAEIWSIDGLGMLNGTRVGRVAEFYAIPYGSASRFEQSVPYGPWDNVLDATGIGPKCLQGGGSKPAQSLACSGRDIFSPSLSLANSPVETIIVRVESFGLRSAPGGGPRGAAVQQI